MGPRTEGLTTLFGCVQDELLLQWRALPSDGQEWELKWKRERLEYESFAVPEQRKDIGEDAIQDDDSALNGQDRPNPKRSPYQTPFQGLKPEMKTLDFSDAMLAAKLTDRQYDCFSLVKEYERPMSEVEQRMGLTRKTIHEHVTAAEKAIRKLSFKEYRAKAAAKHQHTD